MLSPLRVAPAIVSAFSLSPAAPSAHAIQLIKQNWRAGSATKRAEKKTAQMNMGIECGPQSFLEMVPSWLAEYCLGRPGRSGDSCLGRTRKVYQECKVPVESAVHRTLECAKGVQRSTAGAAGKIQHISGATGQALLNAGKIRVVSTNHSFKHGFIPMRNITAVAT